MIEVPGELLNGLLIVLVIFASANRSRQRLGEESILARQSISFQA